MPGPYGNPPIIDFKYDANNQRVKKIVDNQAIYYINSGSQILAEYGNSGDLEAEYIYGATGRIAKYDPVEDEYYLYLTDHLGSTRYVVNSKDVDMEFRRDYYPRIM